MIAASSSLWETLYTLPSLAAAAQKMVKSNPAIIQMK